MIPLGFFGGGGLIPIGGFTATTLPDTAIWSDTAGNGTSVVSVGYNALNGKIARSSDFGSTWSLITNPVNLVWRHVAYGNSIYVIATGTADGASNGRIIYSTNDGVSFSTTTYGTLDINGLLFDGTRFIAEQGGTLIYSTNATSWTSTVAITGLGDRFAKAGSIYISLRSQGAGTPSNAAVCTSDPTVAANWTASTFPLAGANILYAIAGNGVFMAGNDDVNSYYTSTNGTTWTLRTMPTTMSGTPGFSGEYFWYKTVTTNVVYYSLDGTTWISTGQNTASPGRTLSWFVTKDRLLQAGSTAASAVTNVGSVST